MISVCDVLVVVLVAIKYPILLSLNFTLTNVTHLGGTVVFQVTLTLGIVPSKLSALAVTLPSRIENQEQYGYKHNYPCSLLDSQLPSSLVFPFRCNSAGCLLHAWHFKLTSFLVIAPLCTTSVGEIFGTVCTRAEFPGRQCTLGQDVRGGHSEGCPALRHPGFWLASYYKAGSYRQNPERKTWVQ